MSSAGSRDSSVRSSPYSSNTSLNDEEQYVDKPTRKVRSKRNDYDDVEQTIHKVQQDAGEFNQDYQQFRSTNQGHSKRINEMMSQFDDARVRIDRLLQRNSSPREYDFDSSSRYPVTQRTSIDVGRVGSDRSGESSPRMTHKSELVVNPTVPNKKPVFGAVSLTVKLDDD